MGNVARGGIRQASEEVGSLGGEPSIGLDTPLLLAIWRQGPFRFALGVAFEDPTDSTDSKDSTGSNDFQTTLAVKKS